MKYLFLLFVVLLIITSIVLIHTVDYFTKHDSSFNKKDNLLKEILKNKFLTTLLKNYTNEDYDLLVINCCFLIRKGLHTVFGFVTSDENILIGSINKFI